VDMTDSRMEQAIEEECVAVEHRREETSYENEQAEVRAEEGGKTVRKEDELGLPGPQHTCDRVWRTHRMILPMYFRPLEEDWRTAKARCFDSFGKQKWGQDCKSARLPTFPERLGEFVIQDVVHKEKAPGKHVKLTFKGCTSCPNDGTATVDWGGLSTVNENGDYHGGSRSTLGSVGNALGIAGMAKGGGEEIVEVRQSYKCLGGRFTGYSKIGATGHGVHHARTSCLADPEWNTWTTPTKAIALEAQQAGFVAKRNPETGEYGDAPVPGLPVGVTRATYAFNSKKGDTIVEEELLAMDAASDPAAKRTAQSDLIHSLEAEEKRVPFNHKAEQVHIALQVCTDQPDGSMHCEDSVEQLVLHDQALVGAASGQHLTLNEIGDADICTVGHCGPGSSKTVCRRQCTTAQRGRPLNSQPNICRASTVNLDPAYQTPADGMWSCVQEQRMVDGAWTDILVQHDIPMQQPGGQVKQVPVANGLFFREGTESKAHITGGIQWHVTVPAVGGCTPVLQDALYIGMGVDEADICPSGKADLDLGIVLYDCGPQKGAGLGGADRTCRMVDHAGWYNTRKREYKSRDWVAFSGDNQSGEGEGDDEFLFLRLDALRKKMRVTHIAITTHVYGCSGDSSAEVKFGDLEGAFVRIVAGEADRHNFKASATIGYIDLDAQFARTDKYGGLVGVLFLEDDGPKKVGEPSSLNLATVGKEQAQPERHDAVSDEGKHWQLVAMDLPLANGKCLIELNQPYTGALDAVKTAMFEGRELDESMQVANAKALMREDIGHGAVEPTPQVGYPGQPGYQPPRYPAGTTPANGAIHNYLVEQEPENLAYQYEHHGSETSEEAKARKNFGATVNTPEFLDKFTMAMGAGVPGASTYCVSPSWIRQKAQEPEGGRRGRRHGGW